MFSFCCWLKKYIFKIDPKCVEDRDASHLVSCSVSLPMPHILLIRETRTGLLWDGMTKLQFIVKRWIYYSNGIHTHAHTHTLTHSKGYSVSSVIDCVLLIWALRWNLQHYENSPCQMYLFACYYFSFLQLCEHHENRSLFVFSPL